MMSAIRWTAHSLDAYLARFRNPAPTPKIGVARLVSMDDRTPRVELADLSKKTREKIVKAAGIDGKEAKQLVNGRRMSRLERKLCDRLTAAGIPQWEREFMAVPGREFRFDFAWPDEKVAVEVHGATWKNGRHTRGSGFAIDRAKMNLAQLAGWTVLEYTANQIDADAITQVRRALGLDP